jgi:hypothetical protein
LDRDEFVDEDAEEQAEAPSDERDAPTHTPIPAEMQGQEEGEEEPEEDDDEYDAMLHRVVGQYDKPEEAEEEDDEKSALKARLAALESRLVQYNPQQAPAPAPAPEPKKAEPEDDGIDYRDPAVQAALAKSLSDPRTVGTTLKTLVQMEAERLIKKQVGPVLEQVQNIQSTAQEERERSELGTQLAAGLQMAYNMGGLEAAIVREANEKRHNSLLFQYLRENPELAQSPKGIVTATLAVSRAVQKADEKLKSKPTEKKGPAPLSTKRRQTRATKRGQKLVTPPQEGTLEDQVKADILGATRPSQSVEFFKD